MRSLHSAQEEYEQYKESDQRILHAEQRERILALAADFPRVWNDPKLPWRERKRMAHLLLEDVTLRKEDRVIAEIRFKGGALKTLELPLPLPFSVLSRTRPEVVEAIDELLAAHDYQEIVDILNDRGLRSGDGRQFNVNILGSICKKSCLKSRRRQRLRENGMLTMKEMAEGSESKISQSSSGVGRAESSVAARTTEMNISMSHQHRNTSRS